jgi:hypothetical protein
MSTREAAIGRLMIVPLSRDEALRILRLIADTQSAFGEVELATIAGAGAHAPGDAAGALRLLEEEP